MFNLRHIPSDFTTLTTERLDTAPTTARSGLLRDRRRHLPATTQAILLGRHVRTFRCLTGRAGECVTTGDRAAQSPQVLLREGANSQCEAFLMQMLWWQASICQRLTHGG